MIEIAEKLAHYFLVNDFKWKISGNLVTPTVDDIQDVLSAGAERLAEEEGDANLEIGRLVFLKRDNYIDVYVHAGRLR